MKPAAILCDINGSLGDCSNRMQFIEDPDNRDWPGFFRHMMIDKPVDMVHRFVNAQSEWPFYNKVLLVTGAPEKYRPLMVQWLAENEVKYDELFMRGDYQFVKGYEFKRKLYEEQLKDKYDIVLVLDDKEECVNLFRGLGLHCWLVAPCPYPRKDAASDVQPTVRATTRGRRQRSSGRAPRPR